MLFACASAFLIFSSYLEWTGDALFALLPFSGVIGLIIIWTLYHRGKPAWISIGVGGMELHKQRKGIIRWHQILDVVPYSMLYLDHGITIKVDLHRSQNDGESLDGTPLIDRDIHVQWITVSLSNLSISIETSVLARHLRSISQAPAKDRPASIAKLLELLDG